MRSQRGQVAVLFAFGSLALVGMVGLVLMAGLVFWDQRQLQAYSDGAALAGAEQITSGGCIDSSPVSTADSFVAQQVGATSALNLSGWSCGATVTDGFGGITWSATYTYPWNSHPDEIMVSVTRIGIPLQFGALIGTSSANVTARAVAQHNFATLPSTFALYSQNGVSCQGSGVHTPSPKVDVNGSIYSGGTMTYTGNCAIWAHDTTAFDSSVDYGDILVYPDGQTWASGGGQCIPSPPGLAGCADGFELSGHASTSCGNGPGVTPQTEYLNGSTSTNPDPCAGLPPPVPAPAEATYQGTEPNSDPAIYTSIGGQCSATGKPDGVAGVRSAALTVGSKKVVTYGYGPAPYLSGTIEHFVKGCYGYLDLGAFITNATGVTAVQLDPGFYYFNGYPSFASGTEGLCLSKQSVLVYGTDVSFEFVGGTSFSTSTCDSGPTSSCGNNVACDFGTSIAAPSAPSTSAASGTTTLPAGTYTFEITYVDSATGETTASPATSQAIAAGGTATISTTGAPAEAASVNFYVASAPAGVNPGFIGSGTITSGSASLTFNSPTQGNYVDPPPTNSATIWFAAPPTSPEPAPAAPTLAATTGVASNLPAGSYTVEATYRDPEGETTASPSSTQTLTAGQDLQMTTGTSSQGVTAVRFYLISAPAGVTTGYVGQIAAPARASGSLNLTGAAQGNGSSPPLTNTTSSAWCYADSVGGTHLGSTWTSIDTAICANRLLWAPPAGCTCGLSEISGTFYVKGPNENSALMGNIYWPGPANSTPTANAAGCNYDANGVGGLIGQVICDSVFVQGGASAGSATIGWTTGAKYSSPPEISLIE